MATLCTEIGMPKYRENQKDWKRFLPGNIPANICHRRGSACEGVCALCSVRHQRGWLRARSSMLKDTYSCCARVCASVYTTRKCVCLCDSVWRRVHRHAAVFFFLCTSKGSSPHFLRIFFFLPSYADATKRKVFFYAYTHRFLMLAGVSRFVCVHARVRALQQHAIMMSNGSCNLFTLQPLFPPLYASRLSPLTAIIYHTAE